MEGWRIRGHGELCGVVVGGVKLWQQVKDAYPRAEAIVRERPPAGAKDWNNALQAEREQYGQATLDRMPRADRTQGTRLVGKEGRDTRADERR